MKLMSTILQEMYKPEESFVHVITTSYKTIPNRTSVNHNHAKVESGEGSVASWYNKAKFFSRNNPEHHVYLKTFKKIQDAAGSTNLTHHEHHHFVGGQEVSAFDIREEETLDELYDNRSGGGHGHPFFHKITAIDSNFSETKVTEGYGDHAHWLHVAHQISLKNPNHVVKIAHHKLVHFRNGGSGYQHTGNRYFHQGKETSLTNQNLHELNDTSKGPQSFPGDGHWSGNWFVIHHDIRTGKKTIPQAWRWMSKEAAYAAAKHDNNNWFTRDTNKAKFGFPKWNPDKEKRRTGEGQTFREYYFPVHARDLPKHGFKISKGSGLDFKEEVELNELYDDRKKEQAPTDHCIIKYEYSKIPNVEPIKTKFGTKNLRQTHTIIKRYCTESEAYHTTLNLNNQFKGTNVFFKHHPNEGLPLNKNSWHYDLAFTTHVFKE